MLGNDIIDLREVATVTHRHVKKIYSKSDLEIHSNNSYWKILALKEAAFKCLRQMFGLNSYVPTRFSVSEDFKIVIHDCGARVHVVSIEENEELLHVVVTTKPESPVHVGVCAYGHHRTSLLREYSRVTGFQVTEIEKDLDPESPNGYGPPRMAERPGVPISFSHDGRFAAWCFQTF